MDPVAAGATLVLATSAALKTAVSAIVGKAVTQAVQTGSESVRNKLKKWALDAAVAQAAEQIDQVRMVKTIWQIDRAVDLTNFYCPTRLLIPVQKDDRGGTVFAGRGPLRSVVVSHVEDLPLQNNVVVQGAVGQGKSMFLRHLTIVEAVDGHRLPLFAELRRLGLADAGESLEDFILSELRSLGFPADKEVFAFLAEQSRITLLLDAFDEVRESRRERLVHELEALARKFRRLHVIVTSRPGTGIEHSHKFDVCDVAFLGDGEYQGVVRRLCHEQTTAEALIAGLRDSPRVRELLTTPLMVALLVVHFRAEQSIPESHAAFYGDLFMVLLRRHDKTKAGYRRERQSDLSDLEMQRVFEVMCLETRSLGASAFSLQQMFDVAQRAIRACGATCVPQEVLRDIATITCLLLEEGDECRFIHKSVQEYYAASFLARDKSGVTEKFYLAMAEKWAEWRGELEFLNVLDSYRHAKFFKLRQLEQLLTTPKASQALLQRVGVWCAAAESAGSETTVSLNLMPGGSWVLETLAPWRKRDVVLPSGPLADDIRRPRFDRNGLSVTLVASSLLTEGEIRGPALEYVDEILRKIRSELDNARALVERFDSQAVKIQF